MRTVLAEIVLDVVGGWQKVERCHELFDDVLLLFWTAKGNESFIGPEDEVVDLSFFA